jgi:hypothetical protein
MFKDLYELKTFYFYKVSTKYLLPFFKPLALQREHLIITETIFSFWNYLAPSWVRIQIRIPNPYLLALLNP